MTEQMITMKLNVTEEIELRSDPKLSGVSYIDLILPFREAVKLEPGNSNVRLPTPNAPTVKAMLATIADAPETFHLINRGIVYHCKAAYPAKKTLTLTIPLHTSPRDRSKFGILDGGHTFTAIKQTMGELEAYLAKTDWIEPDVRVRLYVNVNDELLPKVAAGLNTSRQVKEYSLAEYRGQFDWYKRLLVNAGWALDTVGFKEGEKRPWSILNINKRVAVFLKERWATKDPLAVYKSSKWALKLFLENPAEFQALEPVFVDVATLPDRILSYFSEHNLLLEAKKLSWVRDLTKSQTRPNTSFKTRIRIDEGLLLPMSAAFRDCLERSNDGYYWAVPLEEILAIAAPRLAEIVKTSMKKAKGASPAVINDLSYWGQLRNAVLQAKMAYLTEHPRVVVRKTKKGAELGVAAT